MRPVAVGGDVWAVLTVPPGDPRLVDRTGRPRVATADPATRTICLSSWLRPPLLDRVLVHELAHAATVSHGLLPELRAAVPPGAEVAVEEWAARLVEAHGIEVAALASEALGRRVCVEGYCHGQP